MRIILASLSLLALAACQPAVPNSAANVGFDNVDSQARAARDAELEGRSVTSVPGPNDAFPSADTLVPPPTSGGAPIATIAGVPPAQSVENAAGISSENNFDAVTSQRSIAADAALIQQNRAQYTVVTPTELPTRPGTDRPNIVVYALQTSNPVGVQLYDRPSRPNETRYLRACASFSASDLAQEDFLARGGPERDRLGVDPDGDGFACDWDPAPFRAARG